MELLDIKHAGAYLGVSGRTVRRLIDRRLITYYKISGSIRIDTKDIDKYLKSQKIEVIDYTKNT